MSMFSTKEEDLAKLLKLFKPKKDYKVEDYYGVSLMRLQKNGKYSLVLQYGYENKNAITSSSLVVENREQALAAYILLDEFSKNSSHSNDLSFLLESTSEKDD